MTIGWTPIEMQRCDICDRAAVWKHHYGGLRCGACPRPADRVDSCTVNECQVRKRCTHPMVCRSPMRAAANGGG